MPGGDQDFARVVAAHRNAILRYGIRRLDDRSAAEDLVAETVTVQVPIWRGSTSFRRSGLIVESSLVMALRTALTSPHPKRCSLS